MHYHIFHIQIDLHNILLDKRSSRSTYELLLFVQFALLITSGIDHRLDMWAGSWKVKRKPRHIRHTTIHASGSGAKNRTTADNSDSTCSCSLTYQLSDTAENTNGIVGLWHW